MEAKEMYINNEILKNHFDYEFNASEFEAVAGEKIQKWIDDNLVFKEGYTRDQDEEDLFDGDMSWVFTQKGERLYRSYLSKVTCLAEKLFPNEPYWNFEQYTDVIYP